MYSHEDSNEYDEVGVATGLAWTAAGGEILHIEATKMKGRGITLTGQLGEVMKESAQTAMGFIRSHAHELGIDDKYLKRMRSIFTCLLEPFQKMDQVRGSLLQR